MNNADAKAKEGEMYKDSAQITEELIDEAAGLKGAVNEVILKCKLLRSKSFEQQKLNSDVTAEFQQEVDNATEQMQDDLDRYQQRLEEIYEELRGYGVIVPKIQ